MIDIFSQTKFIGKCDILAIYFVSLLA